MYANNTNYINYYRDLNRSRDSDVVTPVRSKVFIINISLQLLLIYNYNNY